MQLVYRSQTFFPEPGPARSPEPGKHPLNVSNSSLFGPGDNAGDNRMTTEFFCCHPSQTLIYQRFCGSVTRVTTLSHIISRIAPRAPGYIPPYSPGLYYLYFTLYILLSPLSPLAYKPYISTVSWVTTNAVLRCHPLSPLSPLRMHKKETGMCTSLNVKKCGFYGLP